MKKSTKILGSLALSAALAMGTAVPAFAADMDPGDSASTAVNVTTYTSQISVTVPLAVTFNLDTNGGDGTAPTNYAITNNSPVDVYVQSVQVGMDSDWAAAASKFTAKGVDATATTGDVYAKFSVAGSTNDFTLAQSTAKNLNWKIDKAASSSTQWVVTDGTTQYTLAQLKALYTAADGGDTAAETTLNAIMTSTNQGKLNTITGLDDASLALKTGWTKEEVNADGEELAITISDCSSSILNDKTTTTHNDVAEITYTIGVVEAA